jgi:hypothetical protein
MYTEIFTGTIDTDLSSTNMATHLSGYITSECVKNAAFMNRGKSDSL